MITKIDKYNKDGNKGLLCPQNRINLKHLEVNEIEKRSHLSEKTEAFQTLLNQDPSKLIAAEKTRLVILLRAQGYTISEICKKVKWSKPTVIKEIRKFAVDISRFKKDELEDLLKAYSLTLKKRIHTFGIIMGTLLAELQTRDLKDVPPDRLIDLILKCQKVISNDILSKIPEGLEKEDYLRQSDMF